MILHESDMSTKDDLALRKAQWTSSKTNQSKFTVQVNKRPPSHAALTMDIHDKRSPGQEPVIYTQNSHRGASECWTNHAETRSRKGEDRQKQTEEARSAVGGSYHYH